MGENTNEHLENNMLEDYLSKQSKINMFDLIKRLKSGEKIKAKVRPMYNHKSRRVFLRQLRLVKSMYAESGYNITIITPIFKQYILTNSEILELVTTPDKVS